MRTFIAAALATAFVTAPIVASADWVVHSVNYRTVVRQTRPFVSTNEAHGQMHLDYYQSGAVRGTYSDDQGTSTTFTGHRRDRDLWLSNGQMRFDGAIHIGDIIKGHIINWRGTATANIVAVPIH